MIRICVCRCSHRCQVLHKLQDTFCDGLPLHVGHVDDYEFVRRWCLNCELCYRLLHKPLQPHSSTTKNEDTQKQEYQHPKHLHQQGQPCVRPLLLPQEKSFLYFGFGFGVGVRVGATVVDEATIAVTINNGDLLLSVLFCNSISLNILLSLLSSSINAFTNSRSLLIVMVLIK